MPVINRLKLTSKYTKAGVWMDTNQATEQGKVGESKLLTVGDLLRFLFRRRYTIIAVSLAFLLLGIVYCLFATKRYQSEAVVEVKRPDDTLGLNTIMQGNNQEPGESANPLEENVTLATKVSELTSETLALRVIDELHMEGTKDFQPHFSLNPLPFLLSVFSVPGKKDAPGTAFMDSPSRRAKAFATFERHLKVEVVPGTRLIAIDYASPDPELAASVANALANDLAQYNFQTRQKSTEQLSSWLESQINSVKEQADSLEQQEGALRKETQIYTLGGTNAAGQDLVYSPLIDHLQQSTQVLAQAETSRILRQAVEKILETRDPQLISGLAGSGILSSGVMQSTDSVKALADLQTKYDQQKFQISQDSLRYGDANPKLVEEVAQLRSLKQSLDAEIDRLAKRAKNDASIAQTQLEQSKSLHDGLISQANKINDIALQYQVVHQEARDARQLYTDLDGRLRSAGLIAGMKSNDMTIVSPALSLDKPTSPKTPIILPASLLVGLIFGTMIAGIQDVRDDKVNSFDMVESELGIPVYAVAPDFNVTGGLYGYGRNLYARYGGRGKQAAEDPNAIKHPINVVSHPDSQYAEAMRALRTAILLSKPGSMAKTILITSSTPAEGKSTTSLNLAATYARSGSKVLIAEIDLRKPVLAKRLALAPSPDGLSKILTGQLDRDWALQVEGVPNLSCIPAGQRPPDPHELISSEYMQSMIANWQSKYDLVVLDGPPVLPVIDSVLLSEYADLVLVITRFGRTSINSLRTTHRLLSRQVHANIGAVLNAVSRGSEGYYDYYGYRNDAYKYTDGEDRRDA